MTRKYLGKDSNNNHQFLVAGDRLNLRRTKTKKKESSSEDENEVTKICGEIEQHRHTNETRYMFLHVQSSQKSQYFKSLALKTILREIYNGKHVISNVQYVFSN